VSVAVPAFETTPDRLAREWRKRIAESELPVTVRPMLPTERRLVWDATLGIRRPRGVKRSDWEDAYGPKIDREIDEGAVNVAICGETALGFSLVLRGKVLSMLYVKAGADFRLRGNGIGLMLLEHTKLSHPVTITSPTREWVKWSAFHGILWTREVLR